MINVTIANAMFGYFETLYKMNQNLIKLCGVDVIDNTGQYEVLLKEIIFSIPRLIPYEFSNEEYIISKRDGLMEYSNDIPFLKEEYERILTLNYEFLKNIKKIRNKYEHKMHGAELYASTSDSISLFTVSYRVEGKDIRLAAVSFIAFFRELNKLFSKLQKEVSLYAWKNNKENYVYYLRMTRFDFAEFNRIYDNEELLRVFGKSLFAF